MAASGDITIAQDGGVKAHPYLVALVRWCVSCLWSSATLMLHRILAGYPIRPSITGFTASKGAKPRAAGTEHLHPEPRVECRVLHAPATHSMDVVFVHGLYGSLGNTWRQGDWRSKYKLGPNKVPLLRPSSCTCLNEATKSETNIYNEAKLNEVDCKTEAKINEVKSRTETNVNEVSHEIEANMYDEVNVNEMSHRSATNMYDEVKLNEAFKNIDEKYMGIKNITKDEVFITEKFFDHTVLDQVEILDNYETQAQFVRDLFENENRMCENAKSECSDGVEVTLNEVEVELNEVGCECKVNEGRRCEVGCGCVCDECYSSCWPRDWIKEDYPEARVISINYTSDPYLWRPLWIKESKRLRLHERADQMTRQLTELGVGQRPIIWVGHSKGGLFIKQIYCEAYEAHLKLTEDQNANKRHKLPTENTSKDEVDHLNNNANVNDINSNDSNCDISVANDKIFNGNGDDCSIQNVDVLHEDLGSEEHDDNNTTVKIYDRCEERMDKSSDTEEDLTRLQRQAGLWTHSGGFMFYSVPHRGSPLAGIKTPLTARSVELLEINKDCSLVLTLQDRWLKATAPRRPQVRSLVETCRTLMSVLWLRIVSVPSADAGIGALYGVSVDHREICKPSSRHCLLYRELMSLMRAALNQCQCDAEEDLEKES